MELLLNLSFHAANVVRNLRSVEEARREAVTDDLTALYNRRACDKRLAEEVDRAQRYGRPFSVLMMDVDHYKAVNDRYAHPRSDLVLKQVAPRPAAPSGRRCGAVRGRRVLDDSPGDAGRVRRAG